MYKSDTNHPNLRLQRKLDYLFSLRQGSKVNWDREGYLKLLERLGNDHLKLPPVLHVAGTNGKGSVIATLKAILQAQGYRVHVYTSPHLVRVNERISLAGEDISDALLEQLMEEVWPYIEGSTYSFFEIMTAIAFRAFARNPADILLLEVGCGGRLDCTNVIDNPLATIISRISMDHTEYLGETLPEIAAEKAGIMKKGVPCVAGFQGVNSSEVYGVLEECAIRAGVKLYSFGSQWSCQRFENEMVFTFAGTQKNLPLSALKGEHQIFNAGAAIAVLKVIEDKFPVSWEAIETGLGKVFWPARMQKLDQWPQDLPTGCEIWLDAGHNDSAGEALAEQIRQWSDLDNKPVHLIIGMLGVKDIEKFLSPFSGLLQTVFVVPIPGEINHKTLKDMNMFINKLSLGEVYQSTGYQDSVQEIIKNDQNCRILITGSAYLAGDVLKFMGNSSLNN